MSYRVQLPFGFAHSATDVIDFKRASALAIAVALGFSSTVAWAQSNDGNDIAGGQEEAPADDIVVTGIRSAITQGLESKRRSDVIVESIKSEDIGKFPDKNLAEALQRVPGVAIDRDGGEGRFVTIRGLGPEFNTVLLNGRRIASENYNRSFSFDTISSDLVGGLNVYKTQQSYIREGGVGGTVDVRTARPMDKPGFRAVARVEGLYEENSKKLTPNFSGLVSDTFLDDKVGILVSFSRQERRNRTYTVDTSAIRSVGAFTALPFAYDNFGVDPVYRQQELNRSIVDEHRVRTGLTAALQFKPSDALEINLDYLYSKFNTHTVKTTVSNWLYAVTPPKSAADAVAALGPNYAGFADDVRNDSRTELDSNGVMTKIDTIPGLGSVAFNGQDIRRPTVTHMAGANLKYNVSDTVTLTLDGAWSSAKLKNPGLDRRRSFEILGTGKYFIDATGAVPAVTEIDPGLAASYDNFSAVNVRRQWNSGDDIDAKNYEFSGELNWQLNDQFKLRVGALREVGKKSLQRYLTADNLQFLTYQDSGFAFASRADLESVTRGLSNPNPSVFGQPDGANNSTFFMNFDALDAYMADPANIARLRQLAAGLPNAAERQAAIDAFVANGSSFAAALTGESARVKETVTSAYFDVDGDFELAGRPAHITAGVRYTNTKLVASGFSRVLIGMRNPTPIPGQPAPDPLALEGIFADANGPGGLTALSVRNTYDDFLPSVNFKLELTDDIIFRAAASQSLTRPELDQVTPRFTFGALTKVGSLATTNNPDLRPLKSTNFDASLEWYPAPATSLSIDLFQKQIKGFFIEETIPGQTIPTLPDTATGDYLPEYNNFTITRPSNRGNVRVRGITLSWTQAFDFGGGFQANYTRVSSNRPFDASSYDPTKVALPGLGNSLNLVGFFERGPFAARVAYNRREGFLRNPNFCGGIYCSQSEPEFAKAYDQVDARASFMVTPNVQLYVEGINLTKSTLSQSGRFDNLFVSYENFGRRFTFGASAKF